MAQQPPQQPIDQIICPNCRGGNPPGAQTCIWCHRPLAYATGQQQGQMQRPVRVVNRKRLLWQWVALGVVALLVCGAIASLANPRKPASQSESNALTVPTATVAKVQEVSPTDTTVAPPTDVPASATPEPLPSSTPEPPPTPTVVSVVWTATASASPTNPATPGGSVRITGTLLRDGKPFQAAVMSTTAHYKSTDTDRSGAKTNAEGVAADTYDIGRASAGFTVRVDVRFTVEGEIVARTVTEFTPR